MIAASAPKSQYSAMHLRRTCVAAVAAAVVAALARPAAQPRRPISVDDLMKPRSTSTSRSPDGQRVASAGASLSDLSDTFYLSEGGAFMIDYFKRPWENREGYAAHSPLTFADRSRPDPHAGRGTSIGSLRPGKR